MYVIEQFLEGKIMKRRKRESPTQHEQLKHDPIEDTEYFRNIIDQVRIEAESFVEPDIRLGRSLIVDMEIKRILKEKHNIDWKTPEEMNPNWDLL